MDMNEKFQSASGREYKNHSGKDCFAGIVIPRKNSIGVAAFNNLNHLNINKLSVRNDM